MSDRPFTLAPTAELPDLTINRFPVPPITDADVVDNVLYNRGGWSDAAFTMAKQLAAEKAARLAKRDRFTMTPIPEPFFEEEL